MPPDTVTPPDAVARIAARGGVPRPSRDGTAWTGSINARAAFIAGLMLLTLALLAGSGLIIVARQAEVIEQLGVRDRAADEAVDDFASNVADFSSGFAAVLAGALPPGPAAARMARNAALIGESYARLRALVGDQLEAVVRGGADDMIARLPAFGERVRAAFAARARAEYVSLQEEWLDQVTAYNSVSAAARGIVHAAADRNLARARHLSEQGRWITLGATGIGLLGVVLTWVVLVRGTARPLAALARAMARLAGGETALALPEAGRADQVGEMARAVLVFRDTLEASRRLMEQALEGARRTAVATTQASDAIGQVSDGAMTQLGELREVSEALHQTADAIADVGRTTQAARDATEEARGLLTENLRKVRLLVETVDAVGEDTERVTRIAGTIAKIATQTNILAINAAIEAARAGEHGRGLSVVAEEVRALASSTETLAGEIADVVLLAGRRTREGSGTAAAVGEAMDRLETLAAESARLAAAVAVATEQQGVTVAGLNERMETLTRIGQSSATASEEITVTMIDLSRLAGETRAAVEAMASRGPGRAA